MKKLLFILATTIFQTAILAQTPATETVVADSVIQTDSIVITETPQVTQTTNSSVTVLGDEEYLVYDGHVYNINELVAEPRQQNIESEAVTNAKLIKKVVALAICFIVPCVTILAILIILIVFFLKKNKAKNEIIQKAIDAGYQLPETFYTGQRTVVIDAPIAIENTQEEPGSSKKLFGAKLTDPTLRDSKKFSSGVTLVAVGLALLLFFICQREWGVGMLAGGIPLFVGLGRLIGYFYIPGYTTSKLKRDDYYRHHMHDYYAYERNADYDSPRKTPCPPPCPNNNCEKPE